MSFPVDVFLNTGLEVSAEWTPSGGTASTISGHYINEFEMLSLGLDVEDVNPVFYAKAADMSGVAHGDALTVSGVDYKIISVQPDGYGMVMLELSKDEY